MQPLPKVLVVEDDHQIRLFVARYLAGESFDVVATETVDEARDFIGSTKFDLAILDLMIGRGSGYDLMDLLKAHNCPVIMLTAMAQTDDRIRGLEAGADDYLAKPFDPRELLARVHSVLRRVRGAPSGSILSAYHFDGWTLELRTRKLYDPYGVRVYLKSNEVALLQVFCENSGHILSREKLIELTGPSETPNSLRAIDLAVSRLRGQIEQNPRDPSLILTQRNAGYLFTPKVTAS